MGNPYKDPDKVWSGRVILLLGHVIKHCSAIGREVFLLNHVMKCRLAIGGHVLIGGFIYYQ